MEKGRRVGAKLQQAAGQALGKPPGLAQYVRRGALKSLRLHEAWDLPRDTRARNPRVVATGNPKDAHPSMIYTNLRYVLPRHAGPSGRRRAAIPPGPHGCASSGTRRLYAPVNCLRRALAMTSGSTAVPPGPEGATAGAGMVAPSLRSGPLRSLSLRFGATILVSPIMVVVIPIPVFSPHPLR